MITRQFKGVHGERRHARFLNLMDSVKTDQPAVSRQTVALAKTELTSLKRMTLLGGVAAFLAVLVVATYLYNALEREAIGHWQEHNQPLAAALAGRIDQEMNKASRALRLVADLPMFQESLDPDRIDHGIGGVPESAEPERRRILRRFLNEYSDFSVLFLLAPDGEHYLAEPYYVQRSITKHNMRDRPYFQETLRTADTVISNSYLGADGQLAVAINTPVRNRDGQMIAHLGGVFHLERLSRLIQQFATPSFDEMFLLDERGNLLAHSDPGWLLPDRWETFQQRPVVRQLKASLHPGQPDDSGYRRFTNPDSTISYLGYSIPVVSGWQMVVLRNEETLLGKIQNRSRAIIATTVFILITIAVIGLAIVNGVGRRWQEAEIALRAAKYQLEEEVDARTQELVSSHEHIELLLASTGAGIFGIDLEGQFTFCNRACVETLGYSDDENLLGKGLTDVISQRAADNSAYVEDQSPILTAMREDTRVYREHEIFCAANGKCIPVEYRAYPMRHQGKVIGAVVAFNDITVRINAQRAREESDARFYSLFAQSSDAIFLFNTVSGYFIDANQAAEKLTGRSVEELTSLTIPDICPTADCGGLDHALQTNTTHDLGNVVFSHLDGTERYARLSVVPLADGMVFGIAHDITEKLAAEQALRKSEGQLRALSEAAFEAIFISENGICLGQNRAAEKMFGYPLEEAIGKPAIEWVGPEYRELVRQRMASGTTEPYEIVALRKDGSTFPAEVRGRDMLYQDRMVRFTALQDITERRNVELSLKHTNTLLHAVIDQAPFAIMLAEGTNQDWNVTLVNQEIQRITGVSDEQQQKIRYVQGELINTESRTWQMEEPDGRVLDVRETPLVRAMVEEHATRSKEVIFRRADGSETYVLANASPIYGDDGRQIAAIFTSADITEHKQTEETIRTLSQAMEQSPVSIVITDLDGRIEYVNRGFERTSGYTAVEAQGQHTSILSSGKTKPEVYTDLWNTIQSGQSWQGEFQNRRKDGSLFWEYAHISPIFDGQGRIRHYLGVKEDVTLRKVQEEKILHQAHYDSLTGLPNRFLALDRLSQIVRTAQRENHLSAVLFLDLDDFKKVNDTLGHEVGDQVIEEAAHRVRESIRENDTVGRLGGDEFIVLLAHLHERVDAQRVAEKILSAFRTVFKLGDREILLTASIGIAIYPDDGDTSKILLRNADTAMYHSKSLGRNAFNFYTDSMNQDVSRRVELEEQLYTALQNDEFYLLFQPIVNIHSQVIVGVEALLRWKNAKLGEVPPVEFIEVAERTGRIVEIGDYVLRKAIQQAAYWRDEKGQTFRVAVNVSPVQLKDRAFLVRLENILTEYGLPGDFLEIEVTENVLLSDRIDSVEILNGLRNMGVALSMDDFGTGYSSLSYLRHYHFDTLKIDRSFVRDITTDLDDRELVVATISMARSLGLKVIAEGVETVQQLAILQAEECDFAQGYYFSKPISASSLERLFINKQ